MGIPPVKGMLEASVPFTLELMSDANDQRRGVRSEPALAQNDADAAQKIDGILAQTRADLAGHDRTDARLLLERRLHDAGVALTEDELTAALAKIQR